MPSPAHRGEHGETQFSFVSLLVIAMTLVGYAWFMCLLEVCPLGLYASSERWQEAAATEPVCLSVDNMPNGEHP